MPDLLLRPKDVPAPAWFGRYNFQREKDVARLTQALESEEGPSVILLSGEPGIGRRYLLQAAVHRLYQAGRPVQEVLEIDLEGFDEEMNLARFLELQIDKRREEKGERRNELTKALTSLLGLGLKGTGLATLLSAALSLKEPAATLQKLHRGDVKNLSGELFSAREVFASFLTNLSGRVILHVVDPYLFHAIPSPENPRRWLPEIAERFPHVVLVVSCSPDDELADLVAGTRNGVESFRLARLQRTEVQELLDLRLTPNAFPSGLTDSLLRYSHGLPGLVGRVVWKLELEGALEEDARRTWMGDEVKSAEVLSEGLLDPVSQAFHEQPEHAQALWTFLLDASLCGDLVPANVLIDLHASAEEIKDTLTDAIDEELVERLELFEDLQYSHPSFPASICTYRFRERITRLAILEHFSLPDRHARAEQIAPALRRSLPVQTRDVARLFITVADHLGEAERDDYLRELEWWVGIEEADELKQELAQALADGRLKAETLWGAIRATADRWPSYRRLALLEAYGFGRDGKGIFPGVPVERIGDFHRLRAELLEDTGRYQEALDDARLALRIFEPQDGKHSLSSLITSGLIGTLTFKVGHYREAHQIFLQAVELAATLLGPSNRETLVMKHNLAEVMCRNGDLIRSQELFEEVLGNFELCFGPDHPDTLKAKANLGTVLRERGNLAQARHILEEVLEVMSRSFGLDHLFTIIVRGKLADTLIDQGDLIGAKEMNQEVLKLRNRLLGPSHPHTLASKESLAIVLHQLGILAEAHKLLEEVLEVEACILGTEHPKFLRTKRRLAEVLADQGHFARSRELVEDILEASNRLLGSEHPETLVAKNHLAMVLREQEDLVQARALCQTVCKVLNQLKGAENPETLTSKENLAEILLRQGELSQARELFEEILETRTRVLGPENLRTLVAKNGLMEVLMGLGETTRALSGFEEVLKDRTRLLGSEHFETLRTRHCLAEALRDQGFPVRAGRLFEEVLEARSRVLGISHPHTLRTKQRLAGMPETQGDFTNPREDLRPRG